MKKEIKPDFYKKFRCIAGDCEITCCQEWKIAVDEDTRKQWTSIELEESASLDGRKGEGAAVKLSDYIEEKEGAQVIRLNENHKCPFLNEEKLCKLVINCGEETLSKTCTLFPRQIHEFSDRTEYALVTCCPEVVDMLSKEKPFQSAELLLQEKEESSQSAELLLQEKENPYREKEDFLAQIRQLVCSILEDEMYSVEKALKMAFYVLLDILEKAGMPNRNARRQKQVSLDDYGINYKCISLEAYQKEALQELSDAMDAMEQDLPATFEERNELFLDLAENYRKEGLYTAYLEPIAQLAEAYSADGYEESLLEKNKEFEEKFSEYETLLRRYFLQEIYADFLLPESDLRDLIVAFQWIGMEYAAIHQAVFLQDMLEKERLSYKTVRNYLVVIARMMGYDEDDITEYLQNSFQNLIWDWGYFALIV